MKNIYALLIIPLILSIGIAPALMIQEVDAKTSKWHNAPKICGDKLCSDTTRSAQEAEREKSRMALAKGAVEEEAMKEEAMDEAMMEVISESICDDNKICVRAGDTLKYLLTDTYDNYSENVIINFKENVDDNTIRVYIEGLDDEPLTFNLDLETGLNTLDEYDDFLRPFAFVEPVPLEIGQDVAQWMPSTFNSALTGEESGSIHGIERTLMTAILEEPGLTIEYKYDKETGVLVYQADTYEYGGESYTVELRLIETNMLAGDTMMKSAKEAKPVEKAKPVPVSLLFVQMATSGTFTETDDGYSLVLEGINENTIYFSDRPNRVAGHMPTEELVNKWTLGNDSFESNPPNAVMAIVEPDGTQNAITIALTNPVYDLEAMTLQYTAYVIKDEVDAAEQIDVPFPETFGDVALFIDTACTPKICRVPIGFLMPAY